MSCPVCGYVPVKPVKIAKPPWRAPIVTLPGSVLTQMYADAGSPTRGELLDRGLWARTIFNHRTGRSKRVRRGTAEQWCKALGLDPVDYDL